MAVQYKDYYEILGVARSASQAEIQKAYRKLAKKYHPDVSKAKDADARYKEINEAYEVLKDPDKRSRYDTLGPNWQQGQDFAPPSGWGNAGGHAEYGGEYASFSDFFKTIFGGMGFSGAGSGGGFGDAFSSSVRKRDSEVELRLSLEETVKGGSRALSLHLPGQAERTINVNLPKGVIDGSRIRLPGKASGGGDLYITLRIAPHNVFEVNGYDLTRVVKVAPHLAVLGGTLAVDTLNGSVDVKLPPGIQGGQKLRLKGKGLPKRAEGENGDMFVRVEIVIPKILTERQKNLWQELAEA